MRNAIEEIRNNWVIVLAIVSLIVTWTTFQTRLTQAQEDIDTVESALIKMTDSYNQIDNRLTRIETSVDFIRNNVK